MLASKLIEMLQWEIDECGDHHVRVNHGGQYENIDCVEYTEDQENVTGQWMTVRYFTVKPEE